MAIVARRNIDSYVVDGNAGTAASVYIVATRTNAAAPSEAQIIAGTDGDGNPGVGWGAAHNVTNFSIDVFGETLADSRNNNLHIALVSPAMQLSADLYTYAFTNGLDTLTMPLYASHNVLTSSSSITKVIFVIHGNSMNVAQYFQWAAAAIRGMQNVVLLAPLFQEIEQGPTATELYWGSGWRQGDRSVATDRPFRVSSFAALDNMIDRCRTSYPNLSEIVISGFSAGAQYATRYAGTQTAGDLRYIVGAPSSYLWMDNSRPGPRTAGDNDYKYGLDALSATSYMEAVGATAIRSRFAAAKILTLCGTLDVGDIDALDTTPPALAQGADRTQRFLNYRNHLISYYGNSILNDHPFEFVSGAAHSAELVLGSYAARCAYFGAYF